MSFLGSYICFRVCRRAVCYVPFVAACIVTYNTMVRHKQHFLCGHIYIVLSIFLPHHECFLFSSHQHN